MSKINAMLQYLKVSDGRKIYYQKWMPDNPKAILIFIHGMAEHSGRYGEFTRYFATRDYGVCLYDLRGHGKSGGRRTHVNKFYDFLYDTAQFIEFIRKSSPQAPIFLVGHSFGGQIVLNFIVRYAKEIRGVVALSPHIQSLIEIPNWKMKLGKIGAKVFPVMRVGCHVNPEYLSHDKEVVKNFENDPNVSKTMTLRFGLELFKNSELVMALASRIHLPVLMMHGSDDKICDPEATKKFFMRVPVANKQLKIYPGLYHELLNESCKEEIYRDIEMWLESQLETEIGLAAARARTDTSAGYVI